MSLHKLTQQLKHMAGKHPQKTHDPHKGGGGGSKWIGKRDPETGGMITSEIYEDTRSMLADGAGVDISKVTNDKLDRYISGDASVISELQKSAKPQQQATPVKAVTEKKPVKSNAGNLTESDQKKLLDMETPDYQPNAKTSADLKSDKPVNIVADDMDDHIRVTAEFRWSNVNTAESWMRKAIAAKIGQDKASKAQYIAENETPNPWEYGKIVTATANVRK